MLPPISAPSAFSLPFCPMLPWIQIVMLYISLVWASFSRPWFSPILPCIQLSSPNVFVGVWVPLFLCQNGRQPYSGPTGTCYSNLMMPNFQIFNLSLIIQKVFTGRCQGQWRVQGGRKWQQNIQQARKARRCDSYLQIYQSINLSIIHPLTDWLTDWQG